MRIMKSELLRLDVNKARGSDPRWTSWISCSVWINQLIKDQSCAPSSAGTYLWTDRNILHPGELCSWMCPEIRHGPCGLPVQKVFWQKCSDVWYCSSEAVGCFHVCESACVCVCLMQKKPSTLCINKVYFLLRAGHVTMYRLTLPVLFSQNPAGRSEPLKKPCFQRVSLA